MKTPTKIKYISDEYSAACEEYYREIKNTFVLKISNIIEKYSHLAINNSHITSSEHDVALASSIKRKKELVKYFHNLASDVHDSLSDDEGKDDFVDVNALYNICKNAVSNDACFNNALTDEIKDTGLDCIPVSCLHDWSDPNKLKSLQSASYNYGNSEIVTRSKLKKILDTNAQIKNKKVRSPSGMHEDNIVPASFNELGNIKRNFSHGFHEGDQVRESSEITRNKRSKFERSTNGVRCRPKKKGDDKESEEINNVCGFEEEPGKYVAENFKKNGRLKNKACTTTKSLPMRKKKDVGDQSITKCREPAFPVDLNGEKILKIKDTNMEDTVLKDEVLCQEKSQQESELYIKIIPKHSNILSKRSLVLMEDCSIYLGVGRANSEAIFCRPLDDNFQYKKILEPSSVASSACELGDITQQTSEKVKPRPFKPLQPIIEEKTEENVCPTESKLSRSRRLSVLPPKNILMPVLHIPVSDIEQNVCPDKLGANNVNKKKLRSAVKKTAALESETHIKLKPSFSMSLRPRARKNLSLIEIPTNPTELQTDANFKSLNQGPSDVDLCSFPPVHTQDSKIVNVTMKKSSVVCSEKMQFDELAKPDLPDNNDHLDRSCTSDLKTGMQSLSQLNFNHLPVPEFERPDTSKVNVSTSNGTSKPKPIKYKPNDNLSRSKILASFTELKNCEAVPSLDECSDMDFCGFPQLHPLKQMDMSLQQNSEGVNTTKNKIAVDGLCSEERQFTKEFRPELHENISHLTTKSSASNTHMKKRLPSVQPELISNHLPEILEPDTSTKVNTITSKSMSLKHNIKKLYDGRSNLHKNKVKHSTRQLTPLKSTHIGNFLNKIDSSQLTNKSVTVKSVCESGYFSDVSKLSTHSSKHENLLNNYSSVRKVDRQKYDTNVYPSFVHDYSQNFREKSVFTNKNKVLVSSEFRVPPIPEIPLPHNATEPEKSYSSNTRKISRVQKLKQLISKTSTDAPMQTSALSSLEFMSHQKPYSKNGAESSHKNSFRTLERRDFKNNKENSNVKFTPNISKLNCEKTSILSAIDFSGNYESMSGSENTEASSICLAKCSSFLGYMKEMQNQNKSILENGEGKKRTISDDVSTYFEKSVFPEVMNSTFNISKLHLPPRDPSNASNRTCHNSQLLKRTLNETLLPSKKLKSLLSK